MTKYRLEYVMTRTPNSNKNLSVEDFEYIPLDIVSEDYNEMDRIRCELTEKFIYGFVRIVEETNYVD